MAMSCFCVEVDPTVIQVSPIAKYENSRCVIIGDQSFFECITKLVLENLAGFYEPPQYVQTENINSVHVDKIFSKKDQEISKEFSYVFIQDDLSSEVLPLINKIRKIEKRLQDFSTIFSVSNSENNEEEKEASFQEKTGIVTCSYNDWASIRTYMTEKRNSPQLPHRRSTVGASPSNESFDSIPPGSGNTTTSSLPGFLQ